MKYVNGKKNLSRKEKVESIIKDYRTHAINLLEWNPQQKQNSSGVLYLSMNGEWLYVDMNSSVPRAFLVKHRIALDIMKKYRHNLLSRDGHSQYFKNLLEKFNESRLKRINFMLKRYHKRAA